MSTYDPDAINAHLASLREWDAMTPEERAEAAKPSSRQRILGSIEDTNALNKSERGCSLVLPLLGLAIVVLGGWMALTHFGPAYAVAEVALGSFGLGAALLCMAEKPERPTPPMGGAR